VEEQKRDEIPVMADGDAGANSIIDRCNLTTQETNTNQRRLLRQRSILRAGTDRLRIQSAHESTDASHDAGLDRPSHVRSQPYH